MSFSDERNPEPEFVVDTPAARITVTGPDGEVVQVIEIPERKYTRAEVSPAWLAAHDAEQREKEQSHGT